MAVGCGGLGLAKASGVKQWNKQGESARGAIIGGNEEKERKKKESGYYSANSVRGDFRKISRGG